MSIASPFSSDRATSIVDVQRLRSIAASPIEATAFWAAVLIPLVYPALMVGGLDGRQLSFLLGALVINAAALFVGRDYNRDRA